MSETFEGFRQAVPTLKGTPFVYSSEELKVTGGISTKRCNLTLLFAINPSAADLYFQAFEAAPSSGIVPTFVVLLAAGAQLSWSPSQNGRVFEKLYFGVSTTLPTFTASAEGFWVSAEGVYL